jgi:hypothetical protein
MEPHNLSSFRDIKIANAATSMFGCPMHFSNGNSARNDYKKCNRLRIPSLVYYFEEYPDTLYNSIIVTKSKLVYVSPYYCADTIQPLEVTTYMHERQHFKM